MAQGRGGRGGRTRRKGAPTQASPLPSPPSLDLAHPTLTVVRSRAFMNCKGAGAKAPTPPLPPPLTSWKHCRAGETRWERLGSDR